MNEGRPEAREPRAPADGRLVTRGASVIGALLLVVGLVLIATGVAARLHSIGGTGGSDDQRATAPALRGRIDLGRGGAARVVEAKAMAGGGLSEIGPGPDLGGDADPL